jgi:hypothetical protein
MFKPLINILWFQLAIYFTTGDELFQTAIPISPEITAKKILPELFRKDRILQIFQKRSGFCQITGFFDRFNDTLIQFKLNAFRRNPDRIAYRHRI